MHNSVIGFVLIDAPHSALNMAGQDEGARTDNAVVVKTIRKGRRVYPYVSGQAWKFWWRKTLEEKYEWNMSPIVREAKIAFTSANPFKYPDDDVFGYMRALKKNLGGTLTRIAPLKCSPLVSVADQNPTNDFGVMARQSEGDPVPYEHQFYSTILKGIFSLDLDSVGRFGEVAKTGYKNLDEAYVKTDDIKKSIKEIGAENENGHWYIPTENRIKRAKESLAALNYIYSTTKGSGHLTDVTPKFIILAVVDGGNHIFMNITNDDTEKPVNVDALKQVILDYDDIIKSDILIGKQSGFLDYLNDELETLSSSVSGSRTVQILSPKRAIENFVGILDNYIK